MASVGRTGVLKRCIYSLSEMVSAVETLRTLRSTPSCLSGTDLNMQ